MVAVKLPAEGVMGSCFHKSMTLNFFPGSFKLSQAKVPLPGVSPRLNRPTATDPSRNGRSRISTLSCWVSNCTGLARCVLVDRDNIRVHRVLASCTSWPKLPSYEAQVLGPGEE